MESGAIAASLEAIKVGDTVMVETWNFNGPIGREVAVTHMTPTQIVCGHERFRKRDGRLVGGSYYRSGRLVFGDDVDAILKAERKRKVEYMLSFRWDLEQKSIEKMRFTADAAEAFLKDVGEWTEA